MNGQQGSDLVPGTGRDTLTAEEGGGVVRIFGSGRSRGMLGGVRREVRMDERMDVQTGEEDALYSRLSVSCICLGKM